MGRVSVDKAILDKIIEAAHFGADLCSWREFDIEKLEADLAPQPIGWQTMDTAPRGEILEIVFLINEDGIRQCHWNEALNSWRDEDSRKFDCPQLWHPITPLPPQEGNL